MITLFADDFHHFHLIELPLKLRQGAGVLAAKATRELESLCIRISHSDDAYTYQPGAETVDIIAGTEAGLEIKLDQASWCQLRAGSAVDAEIQRCFGVECEDMDNVTIAQWRVALEIIYGK